MDAHLSAQLELGCRVQDVLKLPNPDTVDRFGSNVREHVLLKPLEPGPFRLDKAFFNGTACRFLECLRSSLSDRLHLFG
ncbi:MAG: hypothetical protein SFV15_16745 [Polyangiaceae bacterium]|nr:hypothetical protein [Polyangiaceae bacterium]